jgi:hypothetical protein
VAMMARLVAELADVNLHGRRHTPAERRASAPGEDAIEIVVHG